MNTTSFKSAKVRNAVKVALGTAVAAPLLFAAAPTMAASTQVGDTTVELNGFVRLDAHWDREGEKGSTLLPSDAFNNPDTSDHDGSFDANSSWTRLKISTTTPTEMGDIGGYIETDFHGDGDSGSALRVRQAYFTWGNWLFGRAWTTFENFHYGTTVDFGGPAGQVFGRHEQVRYTMDLGNGDNFAVALEDGNDFTVTGAAEQSTPLPVLAMRYQGSAGPVSFQAAGLARELKAENVSGVEDEAFGWGLNLGATVALDTGTTFMLSGAYGRGMANYIYTADFGDAAYFDGDSLETNKEWGAVATVSQELTDEMTANVVYGYSQAKRGKSENKITGQSISTNLFYSPVDPLVFGVGYTYVSAKNDATFATGNKHAHANRVSFAAIYNF